MGKHRRRKISKAERFVLSVKKVIAFLLSHVGLCVLVVAYTILGALIFRAVEGPPEVEIQHMVTKKRRSAVDIMWHTTYVYNVLDPPVWVETVESQMEEFRHLLLYVIRRGYDGIDNIDNSQFTLAGAYLYSLTVITTIGEKYCPSYMENQNYEVLENVLILNNFINRNDLH